MGAVRTTVVIPCYNDAATVGETVESVQRTSPSRYRRRRRLTRSGHHRPARRARRSRPDPARAQAQWRGRLGAARRLRGSPTPYVFVIASDDLIDAGAVGALADALDREPGYDFAYGHSHHFGAVDFVRRAAPWNPWILLYSNLWEAACLYRREAVNAAGGFPDGSGYEDWELFIALAERDSTRLLVEAGVPLPYPTGRASQPGRQAAISRTLRNAAAQPPVPLRT